jgi:small-conductance mechanosensitive channel
MAFWTGTFPFVPAWLYALLLFVAITALGFVLQRLATHFLNGRAARYQFARHAWSRTRNLVRFIVALFAAGIAVQALNLTGAQLDIARKVFLCLFVIQLGWIVIVIANIAMDRYVFGLKLDQSDNLLARKAVTQMRILRQAVNLLLGLLTVGFALMSFDSVRQFGISLFASAGIAGIVAGMAARPLFENLIAGLQLAFTQPVRIGDAVVIDNEWGWIEEIGSVYIVVKLWDWRRQIVPLSYLFQTPFTNWTRSSSSLIGTVMLYLDYTLPVDAIRAKAEEIAKASKLWDGKVVNVQVSDAHEQVMQVRILISAKDSPTAWDVRCEMREKLIAWVRDNYPECLPRVRRQDFRQEMDAADRQHLPETHRPI